MTRVLRTGEPTEVISFRVSKSTLARIDHIASQRLLSPALLIRAMVEHRFREERIASAPASAAAAENSKQVPEP